MKNARRFTCPVAEVELLEDMAYTSTNLHTSRRKFEQVSKAKVESVIRKKKVPKVKVEKVDGPPVDVMLTEKQKAQIHKMQEAVPKILEQLNKITDEIGAEGAAAIRAMLPPYVVISMTAMSLKIDEMRACFVEAMESGKADVAMLAASWKDTAAKAKECCRRAKLQIDEARKMQDNV